MKNICLPQFGFCTLLQYPLYALYFPGWQGKSTLIWQSVLNLVPRTSDKGSPKVTSSLDKLYALAKYLEASSATKATFVIFLAMTLILDEADINHSGLLGTCRALEL